MIDLNSVNEIYLYTCTTDFRYGIYGLSRIVLSPFSKDDINKSFFLNDVHDYDYGHENKSALHLDSQLKYHHYTL